ncbi:MAG TPA: recombinase family protein [Candidatus Limnocylindria bacterium]|jgi:DNA invertase Pin-like site-specific DNA recombinase|nr:recombinase family protein [Candidatus Limnocylindria bacterium]
MATMAMRKKSEAPGRNGDGYVHVHGNERAAALVPRVPIVGKAVIYTRVSTDRQQDGASLEVQLEQCRRYCEAHGLIVAAEFRDVLSGLNPDRPKYRQAIELARSKQVDKLIVWRLDRLGRDLAEYATQLRDLKRLGVDVVSVTQPGESLMMQQISGVFAEQESRDKSVRIASSKFHRAKEGKWNGKTPLGYDRKPAPDGRGYVLAPNRDAALVKELFTMYASGKYSVRSIRDHLNKKRPALTRAAVWNLLKNPAYIGMVRHGQWSSSKFLPKPEVTISKGLHPAIVDEATFKKVQARLKSNGMIRGRGGLAPTHLFAGLVRCGDCGRTFVGHMNMPKNAYYYCSRRTSAGDCKAAGVPESRLREAVIKPLESLLGRLHQGQMRTMVRDQLRFHEAAMDAKTQTARAELEAAEARLNTKLTRIEDLYLDGALSKARYLERREGTEAELEAVKAQLAVIPQIARSATDDLFAFADSMNGAPLNDQEWREIVVEMVDRIVVDGEVEVHWKPQWQTVFSMGRIGK